MKRAKRPADRPWLGRRHGRNAVASLGRYAAPGFVLLEMLVVLVLLGLVTALVIPNLERLQSAVTRKTDRDHILDQFAGLGREALLQGRAIVVLGTGAMQDPEYSEARREAANPALNGPFAGAGEDAFGAPSHADRERHVIDLPDGWEIRLDEPLVVHANGVCLGAGLALYHRGAEDVRIRLEPPYCRIDPDV